MTTLTYVKGLPTPINEMTPIGFTQFELFLTEFSQTFKKAVCEAVNHLLTNKNFNKGKFNTHLQVKYSINKRHANGVISHALGKLHSAKECRNQHIKIWEGKLKSAQSWMDKQLKKINLSQKFYSQKNWTNSKIGCNFPISCDLKTRKTNWHFVKFSIHHKKRYIYQLTCKIKHLKTKHVTVKVADSDIFIVGSKDESLGNQICQWDGTTLKFRVPYYLEGKYGKTIETKLGNFDRNINRLPKEGARTYHFYRKAHKWIVGIQFTPTKVEQVSRPLQYGAIGIDLNPKSIGWAYVDFQGNLTARGYIPLQPELPKNKQSAQLVDAAIQLATLAKSFSCPVVGENLDFSVKKEQLTEKGKRYARMLSHWTYSEFFKKLESILANRGISLYKRNPAFTSLIGLTKYSRQYGVSSDVAASIAIARRGMGLSERLPHSITAYLDVKSRKHVWSGWIKFHHLIRQNSQIIKSRHDYFRVSNWGLLVKDIVELQDRAIPKRKR